LFIKFVKESFVNFINKNTKYQFILVKLLKKEDDSMADVEPYVDMPYSEVADLKKQLKKLQDKGSSAGSDDLIKSMTTLTKNMDSMLQLFKTAADEMKLEEREEKELTQQISPIMDKLDEIIEQNKIIAEGMVAVSDLVKEKLAHFKPAPPKQEKPKFPSMPPPQQNMQGQIPSGPMPPQGQPQGPNFPPPTNIPPPPNVPPTNDLDMNMPPPPEEPKKKKGFFGK
jgi:hypothetical protein